MRGGQVIVLGVQRGGGKIHIRRERKEMVEGGTKETTKKKKKKGKKSRGGW